MPIIAGVIEAGFSASLLLNAFLFIPQIITIFRQKSAAGVSLVTFLGFNLIQLFTIFHGLLIGDYLLAAGYFLSILTCGLVTYLVIFYNYLRPRQLL